jgi:hypothetical protein
MQGIPSFQHKCLLGYLDKLREQSEFLQLPSDHLKLIAEQREKLIEVYRNYETSVNYLSGIVKQYKENQHAIRRLIVLHKRNKRQQKPESKKSKADVIIMDLKMAQ